jgi:hypothetical protein
VGTSPRDFPEITLEQLEAKGIHDHEELRKRANEVLGQYDGRASVDESGESGTSKSGRRGLAEQSDAKRARMRARPER